MKRIEEQIGMLTFTPLVRRITFNAQQVSDLKDTMQAMLDVVGVADKSYDEVQRQLEAQSGWMQFEYFNPEIDMHNHISLGSALDNLNKVCGDE